MSHRCEDGHAEVRRHKGGDDDDERENEMNALPARAMLRSMNSVSSIRSHTFHGSVCSAQPRMAWVRPPDFLKRVSAGPFGARLGHDPVLGFDRSHALAGYAGIRP